MHALSSNANGSLPCSSTTPQISGTTGRHDTNIDNFSGSSTYPHKLTGSSPLDTFRLEGHSHGLGDIHLAIPSCSSHEIVRARPPVETAAVEDLQGSGLTSKSASTSPRQRLLTSCRNYFSRGRKAILGRSRPTSPKLGGENDEILQFNSFQITSHAESSTSRISLSSSLKRSNSSPCLTEFPTSRVNGESSRLPTTVIGVPAPLESDPCSRSSTLTPSGASPVIGSRSQSSNRKSLSVGFFSRTDFFSAQRPLSLIGTIDKRKSNSCHSINDHIHFGSLQQCRSMQPMQLYPEFAQPIVVTMAPEILSWIFRHLMDRKSILNCSLVCRGWYGPARGELALFLRDMPYNGQGLVQAIRTRFMTETITSLSVFAFDKLLWNLAEVYYHSNPETEAIFSPQYPPDMLYHLFWTFLFVDQEFRNPRTKTKVNSGYYIRLLQGDGCTYPKPHFHKKVFKNIFNDIRAKPLLPTPHLIQTLQVLGEGHGGGAAALNSLFMRFSGSLRIEDSLRKVRRWWRSMREIGPQINSMTVTVAPAPAPAPAPPPPPPSLLLPPSSSSLDNGSTATMASSSATLFDAKESTSRGFNGDTMFESSDFSSMSFLASHHQQQHHHHHSDSRSSHSSPALHRYSLFGGSARSDAGLNNHSYYYHHHLYQHPSYMNEGFTSVSFGWRPEGDGLDYVVKLPFSDEPSRLGDRHRVLQAALLVAETSGVDSGDNSDEDEENALDEHIELE